MTPDSMDCCKDLVGSRILQEFARQIKPWIAITGGRVYDGLTAKA